MKKTLSGIILIAAMAFFLVSCTIIDSRRHPLQDNGSIPSNQEETGPTGEGTANSSPDSNPGLFDGNKSSSESESSGDAAATNEPSGDAATQEDTTDAVPIEAENLIEGYFTDLPESYHIDYDHVETLNGTDYYVYHGYEVVIDDEATGESHTATWGWYYVDVAAGTIYEWDLAAMVLNPVNNDGADSIQMSE